MELQREGYTYTVDTLRAFERMRKPDEKIYYIIGTDTLFLLETWKEHEVVLSGRLCAFLCVPRPGDAPAQVLQKQQELQEKYGVEILISSGQGPGYFLHQGAGSLSCGGGCEWHGPRKHSAVYGGKPCIPRSLGRSILGRWSRG